VDFSAIQGISKSCVGEIKIRSGTINKQTMAAPWDSPKLVKPKNCSRRLLGIVEQFDITLTLFV
jgi:hypothetical protein